MTTPQRPLNLDKVIAALAYREKEARQHAERERAEQGAARGRQAVAVHVLLLPPDQRPGDPFRDMGLAMDREVVGLQLVADLRDMFAIDGNVDAAEALAHALDALADI
ncbi:hypothetical protein AB0F17_61875 [Nonomuraea sp. NPDC026600]|uniref:hypothetical protein n=1 Tax=Nonomuraea sp. NPDC026600 TaxID=3155363 RepID=UPI0033E77AB2